MLSEDFLVDGDFQERVTCSCGRQNTLRLGKHKYKAIIKGNWSFQKGKGWTCGRADHTQHSTRLVPIPIAVSR